jgi:hypothetical protein
MNQALKVLGIVVLALVAVGVLLGGGFLIGRSVTSREVIAYPQADDAYGPGMMQGWDRDRAPFNRPGMMDRDSRQPGYDGGRPFGPMMEDFGRGLSADIEPLTIEAATEAVQTFLDDLGRENLALGEVMIFDNHAYAVIEDTTTGQGAFEVLVDPVRQVVHLEFGTSMMWNTTYGMHGTDPITGTGRMGGRMTQAPAPWAGVAGIGDFGPATIPTDATPLTDAEAREQALAYLEQTYPDQTLSATAEAFPGYYTFDVETDGAPVSMLSVNAYTGQVWYHTWHGTFVEMSE